MNMTIGLLSATLIVAVLSLIALLLGKKPSEETTSTGNSDGFWSTHVQPKILTIFGFALGIAGVALWWIEDWNPWLVAMVFGIGVLIYSAKLFATTGEASWQQGLTAGLFLLAIAAVFGSPTGRNYIVEPVKMVLGFAPSYSQSTPLTPLGPNRILCKKGLTQGGNVTLPAIAGYYQIRTEGLCYITVPLGGWRTQRLPKSSGVSSVYDPNKSNVITVFGKGDFDVRLKR